LSGRSLFTIRQAKPDSAQETMLSEKRRNRSLGELAAMLYLVVSKSTAMQRAFIAKTQQLNYRTQILQMRYPIMPSNIVVCTSNYFLLKAQLQQYQ